MVSVKKNRNGGLKIFTIKTEERWKEEFYFYTKLKTKQTQHHFNTMTCCRDTAIGFMKCFT